MANLLYNVKSWFLTKFGDLKVYPYPFFLVYHPTSFKVKGSHTRQIMNNILPGDVVMRGYVNYLDGYFIPKGESGCSHSGLYIGGDTVVHSIAEGLSEIDIIDFCRADRIVVLRAPEEHREWAIKHAKKCADAHIPYDFDFEPGPGRYYCHEFTASCYPNLGIEQLSRKVFGLIDSPTAYLADSFYTNANFTHIYPSADGQPHGIMSGNE